MSTLREILIIQSGAGEVRLLQAEADLHAGTSCAAMPYVREATSFCSSRKDNELTPLRDQTVLDAFDAFITERGLHGHDVIFVLGGSQVSCQYFDMPPLSGSALQQAVTLKLKQQLHFSVEDAALSIRTIDSRNTARKVSVNKESLAEADPLRVQTTAVHRDLVDAALAFARHSRLNVLAMCAGPDVLAAAAMEFIPTSEGLHAVLDFGELQSTLVILHRNIPCVCADLPLAATDITAALMRPIISGEDVLQLDESRAVELRDTVGIPAPHTHIEALNLPGERLLPLVEPFLQKLGKQLTQWLTFATTSMKCTVEQLDLVGQGAGIRGLAAAISMRTSLKVESSGPLQEAMATTGAAAAGNKADEIAVLAARYWRDLPDLIPSHVRRDQRMRRWRRGLAVCSPLVGAAIILLAVLLARVDHSLRPALDLRRRQLAETEQQVANFRDRAARAEQVRELQGRFEAFGDYTPHWVGVFKELSLLLPAELQATEYRAETRDGTYVLTIQADVMSDRAGRDFDEVVSQTLLMLQRSAFFRRVEVVSAQRELGVTASDRAGVLSIQLDLAYPRTGARGRA